MRLYITLLEKKIHIDNIITPPGWNDGKIRILGFKAKDMSLELKHVVMDAHNKGVTAVALTTRGDCIVSGGGDGMVSVCCVGLGSCAAVYPSVSVCLVS